MAYKNQIRQAEIKVGFTCNNHCLFCLNAHKKGFPDVTSSEIKKSIRKAKEEGVREISFTGGEVTIRKDFFDICSFVFKQGLRLEIQTNGRMFYYEKFAKRFEGLPISFLISIHGLAGTHNRLTGILGSYDQTMKGIDNLKKNKLTLISNTVINKLNISELLALGKILESKKVDSIQFTWPEKMGAFEDNILLLKPDFEESHKYLLELMNYSLKNNNKFSFLSLPYCLFPPKFHRLIYFPNIKKLDYEMGKVFTTEDINTSKFFKEIKCKSCRKNQDCLGFPSVLRDFSQTP